MAGKVTVNQVQLGDSGTSSQNFVVQSNADGSGKLARGNVGATTQDIVTWDANGRVALPQTVVAFSAYNGTAQSLPHAVLTKLQLPTEEYDTASAFDSVTNHRFQPAVSGYYQITGYVLFATNGAGVRFAALSKNGAEFKRGIQEAASASFEVGCGVSAQVFLNGGTDYVELFCLQNSGAALNTFPGQAYVYFQGILLQKA